MNKEPLLKKIVDKLKDIGDNIRHYFKFRKFKIKNSKQETTNKNISRDVIPGLNRNPESPVSPVKAGFQIQFGMTRKGSKFKIPNSIFRNLE